MYRCVNTTIHTRKRIIQPLLTLFFDQPEPTDLTVRRALARVYELIAQSDTHLRESERLIAAFISTRTRHGVLRLVEPSPAQPED